jgi:isoaspartyl peptidase/L-asparaginase-like protein (Ntn-hydrolase superfamily)
LKIALAIHGGAGATRKLPYDHIIAHLRGLVESARDRLFKGGSALDVATSAVTEMEASGLYVAGRGCSPNASGDYELDASLRDGASGRAGAVAALQGFESPIAVARLVMERTHHVLLVGSGAAQFAGGHHCARVASNRWFTHAGAGESNHAPGCGPGTVGCTVLDADGQLAAATSSAGIFDKLAGRVGDSPIIGAGTWADDRVAISCTGTGELFLRTTAAARVAWRMRDGGDLLECCDRQLDCIEALGGEGGIVAVDRDANVAMPYRAEGMKRASLTRDGSITASVFD